MPQDEGRENWVRDGFCKSTGFDLLPGPGSTIWIHFWLPPGEWGGCCYPVHKAIISGTGQPPPAENIQPGSQQCRGCRALLRGSCNPGLCSGWGRTHFIRPHLEHPRWTQSLSDVKTCRAQSPWTSGPKREQGLGKETGWTLRCQTGGPWLQMGLVSKTECVVGSWYGSVRIKLTQTQVSSNGLSISTNIQITRYEVLYWLLPLSIRFWRFTILLFFTSE
jgi:hypothetical protein